MTYTVFICGSALRGQPDHHNLQESKFLGEALSVPNYRLHSVRDGWHPGIREVDSNGVSIPGELYQLNDEQYAHLVATEPPHMYPAQIVLDDGQTATAFFYPENLIQEHGWLDISDSGGWAKFKAQKK